MSRQGRSVDSPISADSVDRQVVAYFHGSDIVDGLFHAFIGAMRTGIPVQRLPGQSVFASTHVTQTIDTRQQQIHSWEAVKKIAQTKAQRAHALSLDPETDDEGAARYRDDAKAARRDAQDAIEKIAALRATPTYAPATKEFDVFTDVWIPALMTLRKKKSVVDQAAYTALRTIMPQFQIVRRSGQWYAKATIRVNTGEGVAELGPVEWQLSVPTRGTAAIAANMSRQRVLSRASREVRKDQLKSAGMTPKAANVLANAPFPQPLQVLLHTVANEPLPAWVEGRWRDRKFMDWLTQTYMDPNFRWLPNGKYADASSFRQLLVDYAAEHGSFRIRDVTAVLPIAFPTQVWRLSRPETSGRIIRDWQPSLTMVTSTRSLLDRELSAVLCACGEPARVVTRVPEIPRDLLCGCGRMPDEALHGVPEGTLFPQEYLDMRLPREVVLADTQRQFDSRKARLTVIGKRILRQVDLLETGATGEQLRALAGPNGTPGPRSGLSIPLRRLEAQGLISGDGARPQIWRYTVEGRSIAESLMAGDAG